MAAPFSVPIPLVVGASQQIITGPGFYKGGVVRELSAAPLVLRVWDGTSATGTIIDIISVAANAVVTSFNDDSVAFSKGVFVERVTGTNYEGSLRIA